MTIELDPSDPFDKVLVSMVETNRRKRRDYAADSDIFSNFRDSAFNLAVPNFGAAESAYHLLLTKVSRLRSLRLNGRLADPSNESVLDTVLDLAVYAVITLALTQEGRKDETFEKSKADLSAAKKEYEDAKKFQEEKREAINSAKTWLLRDLRDQGFITPIQCQDLINQEILNIP